MADNNIIDSLRVRVEADAKDASGALGVLATQLKSLKTSLEGIKNSKIDASFITKGAVNNINAFSSAIDRLNIAKLGNLATYLYDLKPALEPLSKVRLFSTHMAENAELFSRSVREIDIEKLQKLSTVDLSNLERAFSWTKELQNSIHGLSENVGRLASRMAAVTAPTAKATVTIRQQAKAAHAHHKAFSLANTALGRFLRLVKRIVMMRMIRTAIRQFTQGFAEGIKNLYFWSQAVGTSFAPAMDDLAKHVLYLKNGFASMWSPLLERRVIPFINSVIERLVDFFNLIQENFARLVGAPTWNKALLYPVQFAENTEQATKAAKALHNILMGFDELNVINTPHDSGSGSGKDAVDYSSMFKTMETKGGIAANSIGEALAKAFNKLFENPEKWGDWGAKIAGWLVDGFDNALDFFEGVNWENIGASISEFATKFVNKLSDWFDDTENWTRAINVLTDAVCGLIDGVKWDELSKSIASLGGKVALALPSQVLAGVEGGAKILATAFDKLGWGGAADGMREFAENVKDAREEYEGLASDTAKELDIYLGRKPNAKGEYESHSFLEDMKEAATVTQDTIDKRLHPHQQQSDAIYDYFNNDYSIGGGSGRTKGRAASISEGQREWFKQNIIDPISKFFEENPTPIVFVSNIIENVKKWIQENITDPIKKQMKENPTPLQFVSNLIGGKTAEWVRTNITDPVKKFFEKNPTPIKFVTNFFNKAHEWIKTNVSDPIKKFFEENPTPIKFVANILETVRQKWQEFKQWWGNVWEEIKLKVPNIREKVREKWESFKAWWSTLAVNLKINFPDLIQKLREKWNALVAWWRNLSLPSFHISLPHLVVTQGSLNPIKWFAEGLPKIEVQWYAKGGFPAMGQPFFMGEGGVPEMLGKVNGRSAVVGGAEITGIADAIRASGAREEYLLQVLISVVQSKDFSFTPNAASGRMINEALQHYAGVTG